MIRYALTMVFGFLNQIFKQQYVSSKLAYIVFCSYIQRIPYSYYPKYLKYVCFYCKNLLHIFTKKCTYMEVISFTFEFSRCIYFICHDSGNGFFNIFHPFNHFSLAHEIDIFDERVILLPESHFDCLGTEINFDKKVFKHYPWFFKLSNNEMILSISECNTKKKLCLHLLNWF